MEEIKLQVMTRELCHEFYKDFENDPAIYMDMSKFSPYKYSKEKVDKYFDEQQIESRIVFIIMLKDKPVGEVSVF